MRFMIPILAIALTAGTLAVRAESRILAGARALFERYVVLSDTYDSGLTDLYMDSALIRAYRRYPHGLERSMQLTGAQWKALLVKTMPLAKAQADRSTFSKVRVTADGNRARIEAERYSQRKCYTDSAYYMVVERQANDALRIVEEYFETQPQSQC